MEGLRKTKENGHYNDTVRATYQNLVMMGVGINNIEKVVRTVLTNFTNMNLECLLKQHLRGVCTQNQEDLVNSK